MDIFRNVRLWRSRGITEPTRRDAHARTSELSIVQNPAYYVTVSLRKLVTLNLRYRSIGRLAKRPTVVKRRSDIRERIEILRLLWLRRNARLFSRLQHWRLRDLDSTLTRLGCCFVQDIAKSRISGRICPSASANSLKLEAAGGHKFLHLEIFELDVLGLQKKLKLKN